MPNVTSWTTRTSPSCAATSATCTTSYAHNFLRYYGVDRVDAILADLGVSSHHFDDSERGFSFRFDGQLDMRMNKRAGLTAADVVNTYDEERLADIFYLYGELKNSRKLASLLAKARAVQKIVTIGDFLNIVKPLFGREREKKELAKVFQALRIEVNQEMEASPTTRWKTAW